MGVDERNTNDMIKTDAFARRMPSHRGQKPARRRPQQSLSAAQVTPPEPRREKFPAENSVELAEVPAEKVEAVPAEPVVAEAETELVTEEEAAVEETVAADEAVIEAEMETVDSAEPETAEDPEPAVETAEETEPVEETAELIEPEDKEKVDTESADEESSDPEVKAESAGEEAKQPEQKVKAAKKPASKKTDAKQIFGKTRRGFTNFVKNHKQLTGILATVLLIIIVLIVLAATAGAKHRKSDNYMDQIRNQEIKLNDVAAIDDFFVSYYTGLSSGNTTELEAMFDDPAKANITTEISTIVNQYDNFKVYVTPGIEENDIVAFVGNDIHFANIDATAPSVDSFYLKYDKEAAALKICSDMYTDQNILKFMNLVSYREPIRSLLTDTNNRLSDALAGNKDLNNLYILMQSMTESAEQAPVAEETTAEE